MAPTMQDRLRATEEAVNRLLEGCAKSGMLYARNLREVAQVSRTGKWLLNALAALRKALATPCQQLPQ